MTIEEAIKDIQEDGIDLGAGEREAILWIICII